MSLSMVWVQTQGDGLVRADQVVGIEAHQTPQLSGKPARWLLDVVLASSIGSGTREEWRVTVLHRTLIQTSEDPGNAPAVLARLLAQLNHFDAAGVITASRAEPVADTRAADPRAGDPGAAGMDAEASLVRFRFVPFPSPAPGHHTGSEYL